MKLKASIILPIILAALIGAGLGYAWEVYAQGFALTQFGLDLGVSGLVLGTLVFCALLTILGYYRSSRTSRNLKTLEEGLRFYETRLAARLDAIETSIPPASRLERIERKLSHKKEDKTYVGDENNIVARVAQLKEELSGLTVKTDDIISNNENVVRLRPLAEVPVTPDPQITSDQEQEEQEAPTGNIKKRRFSTDGMHIRLQPAVCLETREILAFETSVCVADRFGNLHDDANVRSLLETNKDYREFDKHLHNRALAIVRSLRRQGKSPLVFVGISPATLKSAQVFEDFTQMLQAQRKLNKNIIWEIKLSDYLELPKAHQTKLRTILENGYSLCLGECKDQDKAADLISEGLFSYAKMPVSELEHVKSTDLLVPVSELKIACEQSKVHLIVTNVERDTQAIQVIDHEIQYGQGDFFSPPKFPNNRPSDAKNGTKN